MQDHNSHNEHHDLEDDRIAELRKKLEDPRYMNTAVQELAGELTIEIMENTYGVSFH